MPITPREANQDAGKVPCGETGVLAVERAALINHFEGRQNAALFRIVQFDGLICEPCLDHLHGHRYFAFLLWDAVCAHHHRQKIAKASMARRTPSNGLETANQKEKFQPEFWAIGFVFMVFSKEFEPRHFIKREISCAIWIVDAHRGDGKRYVVRANEMLTAFLELEAGIRAFGQTFIEEIAGADSGILGD